jgi:hypothetical protein
VMHHGACMVKLTRLPPSKHVLMLSTPLIRKLRMISELWESSSINLPCVWLENRGSGAEPSLVLGTTPTPPMFGLYFWVGDGSTPALVWMDGVDWN